MKSRRGFAIQRFFFFQAEDGIRDHCVTGVQTCALPIFESIGGFGGGAATYQLMDSTIPGLMDKDETSLFDGIDVSLAGVAQYAGANPPAGLKTGLAAVVDQAQRAKAAFDAGRDAATAEPIEAGLAALRA